MISNPSTISDALLLMPYEVVTKLKFCRYGVKHYPHNQSIMLHEKRWKMAIEPIAFKEHIRCNIHLIMG